MLLHCAFLATKCENPHWIQNKANNCH